MESTLTQEENLTWDKLNTALARGENIDDIFNLKAQDSKPKQSTVSTTEAKIRNTSKINPMNLQHKSGTNSSFSLIYCREDPEAILNNVKGDDVKLLPSPPFVLLDDIATLRYIPENLDNK